MMKPITEMVGETNSEWIGSDLADGLEPPEGWSVCDLGGHVYIAGRIGWRGLKAEEYTTSGPVLLSVPNLNHGDVVDFSKVNHISQDRYDESPEIKLQEGDTLLVKDGAGIGKLGFVQNLPDDSTVNSSLLVVRPQDELLIHKYLFYYLKGPQFQQLALQRITGSATPHLFQKDIKRLRILVASLAEQRRIIARLESSLAAVTATRNHLSRVPAILKRFRQAVLAAACSGRLTEDWRREHCTGQADDQNESELPQSWTEQSIEQLCKTITDGEHLTPQTTPDGVALLSAKDVREDGESFEDCKFVSQSDASQFRKRCNPEKGDVLVVSRGATIGRVTNVRSDKMFCLMGSVILLKVGPTINSTYLALFLASPLGQERLTSLSGYTAQQAIYLRDTRSLHLPVPTMTEQEEIVRRTNALFFIADLVSKNVHAAKAASDKLTQSILAKAFRGELVPTEAELARREGRDYESASVLLERIRKERESQASRKPQRKRTRPEAKLAATKG